METIETPRVIRVNGCKIERGKLTREELSTLMEGCYARRAVIDLEISQLEDEALRMFAPELIGGVGCYGNED